MAISLNIKTSRVGVGFKTAYYRIGAANVSRAQGREVPHIIVIDVNGFATKPSDDSVQEIDFRRYHAPLAEVEEGGGENFLTKCYAWVMAQEDMKGGKEA